MKIYYIKHSFTYRLLKSVLFLLGFTLSLCSVNVLQVSAQVDEIDEGSGGGGTCEAPKVWECNSWTNTCAACHDMCDDGPESTLIQCHNTCENQTACESPVQRCEDPSCVSPGGGSTPPPVDPPDSDPDSTHLTVKKDGTGTGTVTGKRGTSTVISCGSDCLDVRNDGRTLTINLVATPSAGSRFTGWSLDSWSRGSANCSTTSGVCDLQVTGERRSTITATFEKTATPTTLELTLRADKPEGYVGTVFTFIPEVTSSIPGTPTFPRDSATCGIDGTLSNFSTTTGSFKCTYTSTGIKKASERVIKGGRYTATGTKEVRVINRAPTLTITGPSTGVVNENLSFSFKGNDLEGDRVRYLVDWNEDGRVDERFPESKETCIWGGLFCYSEPQYVSSGTTLSGSYSWSSVGGKRFQAYTEDSKGAKSSWVRKNVAISAASGETCATNPSLPGCAGSGNSEYDLTINVLPSGAGMVSGAGIYTSGTRVMPVVTSVNQGYEFSRWGGSCSGSGTCSLIMDSNKTVTAQFTSALDSLSLKANPVWVTTGGASTLTWDGATSTSSCSLVGGRLNESGLTGRTGSIATGSVTEVTPYRLTCGDGASTKSVTATVYILPTYREF